MCDMIEDSTMLDSGRGKRETGNDREREISVRKGKGTRNGEKIFRKLWNDRSRKERGDLCCRRRNTCGDGRLYGGRRIGR
jgi:hypothetical protein